jgi:DNA polymerase III epsilon subunit-like protein
MDYFLDTKATGTGDQDVVIEVSLIDEKGTNHLTTLVSPLAPIGKSARQTHGLSKRDLENAPRFVEVAPRLYRFFSDEWVETVWAYNAHLNRRLLTQTAEAAGVQRVIRAVRCSPWRDLKDAATEYLGADGLGSLAEAGHKLDVEFPNEDPRRALGGAELTRRIWIELKTSGHLP